MSEDVALGAKISNYCHFWWILVCYDGQSGHCWETWSCGGGGGGGSGGGGNYITEISRNEGVEVETGTGFFLSGGL